MHELTATRNWFEWLWYSLGFPHGAFHLDRWEPVGAPGCAQIVWWSRSDSSLILSWINCNEKAVQVWIGLTARFEPQCCVFIMHCEQNCFIQNFSSYKSRDANWAKEQSCRNPICSRYLEQLTKQRENKSQMWWMKSFEVIIFGASTMFVMLGWFLEFLRTLVKGLFTFLYCQIYGQWKSFMSRFSNLHAPQSTFFFFLFCFMCRVKPRKWTKSIRLCSDSDSANRLLKRKVWSILRLPATDGHGIVRIQACGLSMTLFWPLFKNLYVPV